MSEKEEPPPVVTCAECGRTVEEPVMSQVS